MFSEPANRDQPSRSKVIKWLRINFALMIAIGGAVSSAVTGLIFGTVRLVHYDDRLEHAEAQLTDLNAWTHTRQEAEPGLNLLRQATEREIQDLEHRMAAQEETTSQTMSRRLKLADDLSLINARIVAVETKEMLVGDFIRNNVVLQTHPFSRSN